MCRDAHKKNFPFGYWSFCIPLENGINHKAAMFLWAISWLVISSIILIIYFFSDLYSKRYVLNIIFFVVFPLIYSAKLNLRLRFRSKQDEILEWRKCEIFFILSRIIINRCKMDQINNYLYLTVWLLTKASSQKNSPIWTEALCFHKIPLNLESISRVTASHVGGLITF